MKELENYFIEWLKPAYQSTLDLFNHINDNDKNERNLTILKDFVTRLHEKETIDGHIREILYDIIYSIEPSTPIVYKTVQVNTINANRTTKNVPTNDCIIHCRCNSVYDEISLVQCYACQVSFV